MTAGPADDKRSADEVPEREKAGQGLGWAARIAGGQGQLKRSSSSQRRRRQASVRHANAPAQPGAQPGGVSGMHGEECRDAGSREASQQQDGGGAQQIRSGLEMGIAAGMLPLPADAVRDVSTAGAAAQQSEDAPAHEEACGGDVEGERVAGASQLGGDPGSSEAAAMQGVAEPSAAAGSGRAADLSAAEGERQRGFLELLHSRMQARQEQKKQVCGPLTGPSLAAALATGARARKVAKPYPVYLMLHRSDAPSDRA